MADRDAAFREALDAYISLVQWLRAWALNRDNTRPSEEEINAARARVLALYAERQGEEAVVTDGTPDGQYIELRFVQSTRITDGDRVWVVKVEEAK